MVFVDFQNKAQGVEYEGEVGKAQIFGLVSGFHATDGALVEAILVKLKGLVVSFDGF